MKAILRVLLVALVVMIGVTACGPSPEELYQQGVGYYYNKDYSKAVECFTKAAKKGHKESEKYLAMIVEGKPQAQNNKVAKPIVEEIEEDDADYDMDIIDDEEEELLEEEIFVEENIKPASSEKPKKEAKPVVKEETPKKTKSSKPATSAFSVSDSKTVYFAKGNLQYQATTKKWRFAEHQWDVIGEANAKIAPDNSGWIDLFGWGTGANPTKNTTGSKDYTTFTEWGKNAISNGGGSKWRTLTREEWEYVVEKRETPSEIRYAKAVVNGVKGLILLPDNWKSSYYKLDNVNRSGANFNDNDINKADWANKFESKGAVFLPNGGSRKGNSVTGVGKEGYYWTSTNFDNAGSYGVYIYDRNVNPTHHYYSRNGLSVRLVRNAN